jgi:AraC family transcriptional regulator
MRNTEASEVIGSAALERRSDHTHAVREAVDNPEHYEWARYEPRMQRVIAHVHDHLDTPLDLNALAELACLSPHHWHRIYHAMYGETLAHTVKRLRLHRAAGQLACSAMPVAEVARAAAYPSVPSFNRTFKSVYGLPPARFRAEGQHRDFELQPKAPHTPTFEVAVVHTEPLAVLAVEHRGSYMAIGRAFDLLFTRLVAAGLARPGMRMLSVFFDDPDLVAESTLRAHAAVTGFAEPTADCGLLRTTLPAATVAMLTHTGPYSSMQAAYRWLFGDWLVNSGFVPASGPVVEEYLNSPRDTAPQNLRTLIQLPLQSGGIDT